MIDWTTCTIEVDASPLKVGRMISLEPGGEINYDIECYHSLESPSHDATIRLSRTSSTVGMRSYARSHGRICPSLCLRVSGNPVKWLQGHNVIGVSPTHHVPLIARLLDSANLGMSVDRELPAVSRSRMDITRMYNLGNGCDAVHSWIDRACMSRTRAGEAQISRDRRGLTNAPTCYVNKSSRRWSIKAYCKYCELLKRPHSDPNIQAILLDYALGKLRLELTLRGDELRQYGTLDEEIIYKYYKRVTMANNTHTDDHDALLKSIPNAPRGTLLMWLHGYTTYQSMRLPKNTYYRHRRQIIEHTGVDISIPLDKLKPTKDGSLDRHTIKYLKGVQESIFPDHPITQYSLQL